MTSTKGLHANSPSVKMLRYALMEELKKFKRGDKFFSVLEVEDKFMVSKGVALCTLQCLRDGGLLDAQNGRGYFVN